MMDKIYFDKILQHSYSMTKEEWSAVREERSRYPYSSLLQLLDVMGARACKSAEESTFDASLYMMESNWVASLLSQVVPPLPPKQEEDIFKEINSYQEVSYKTAPKSVILSDFLESTSCGTEDLSPEEHLSVEDLGKKSVALDDSLCTETLAIVFEKQGKLDQAVGVYEKLMLKYPEKSSTFATQISKIKSKIQ